MCVSEDNVKENEKYCNDHAPLSIPETRVTCCCPRTTKGRRRTGGWCSKLVIWALVLLLITAVSIAMAMGNFGIPLFDSCSVTYSNKTSSLSGSDVSVVSDINGTTRSVMLSEKSKCITYGNVFLGKLHNYVHSVWLIAFTWNKLYSTSSFV